MKLLFLSDYISPVIIQAICRTLLHSLWQGLLAAAIAGIIILFTKRSKAAIRYNLLSFVFISFIISSAITFLDQPGVLRSSVNNSILHFAPSGNNLSAMKDNYTGIQWLPESRKENFYQSFVYYTDKYAGWITGLWMLFFLIHLLRTFAGLHYVHRIRNYQVAEPDEEWKQRVTKMRKLLGIQKAVTLMESGLVKVPVVAGTLKPMILIPFGMISNLSTEQVETILLHELAHVRRKDFTINLLQRVAEAFFFFNPFIAWVSARIREEREACCDDIVMEHIPDKRSYLEALVSFRQPGAPAYGHAMALGRNNNLLHRVKRMITQENKKLNAMEKLTLILVLMAFGALSFMPAGRMKKEIKKNVMQQTTTSQGKANPIISPVETTNTLPERKERKDTLPEKQRITFSNISSSVNDDGTTRKAEVTAKASDGKTYSYRIVNNKIIELAVNGEKIKEENFYRYNGIIDQVEDARRESIQKSLEDQQRNTKELLEKQELLQEHQLLLQKKLQEDFVNQNNLTLAQKNLQLTSQDNLNGMQNKLLLDNQNNLTLAKLEKENAALVLEKMAQQDKVMQELKAEEFAQKDKEMLLKEKEFEHHLALQAQKDQEFKDIASEKDLYKQQQFKFKSELLAAQDEKFHDSNYDLSLIIASLGDAGIIADKKDFSFSLNNDELIVDGKKQPANLHESLRKRFIRNKKDYFKYKAKQNSRSTDIYVE